MLGGAANILLTFITFFLFQGGHPFASPFVMSTDDVSYQTSVCRDTVVNYASSESPSTAADPSATTCGSCGPVKVKEEARSSETECVAAHAAQVEKEQHVSSQTAYPYVAMACFLLSTALQK